MGHRPLAPRDASSGQQNEAGAQPATSGVVGRLAVRVIRGEGVVNSQGHPADTRVLVECEGVAFSSKIVAQDSSPEWNLSCVFDLKCADPLSANISFCVRSKIAPWQRASIGTYSSNLEALIAAAHGVTDDDGLTAVKQSLSQPAWISLTHKGQPAGRLEVQVHFVKDVEHRPLRVLAVTWNVGDVPPSESLQFCFPNIASGMYDLVVVGAQEVPRDTLPGKAAAESLLANCDANDDDADKPAQPAAPALDDVQPAERPAFASIPAQRGSESEGGPAAAGNLWLPAPSWPARLSGQLATEAEPRGRLIQRAFGASDAVRSTQERRVRLRSLFPMASASPRTQSSAAIGQGHFPAEPSPTRSDRGEQWLASAADDEPSHSGMPDASDSLAKSAGGSESEGDAKRAGVLRSWKQFTSSRSLAIKADGGSGDAPAGRCDGESSPEPVRLDTPSPSKRGKSRLVLQPVPPDALRVFARDCRSAALIGAPCSAPAPASSAPLLECRQLSAAETVDWPGSPIAVSAPLASRRSLHSRNGSAEAGQSVGCFALGQRATQSVDGAHPLTTSAVSDAAPRWPLPTPEPASAPHPAHNPISGAELGKSFPLTLPSSDGALDSTHAPRSAENGSVVAGPAPSGSLRSVTFVHSAATAHSTQALRDAFTVPEPALATQLQPSDAAVLDSATQPGSRRQGAMSPDHVAGLCAHPIDAADAPSCAPLRQLQRPLSLSMRRLAQTGTLAGSPREQPAEASAAVSAHALLPPEDDAAEADDRHANGGPPEMSAPPSRTSLGSRELSSLSSPGPLSAYVQENPLSISSSPEAHEAPPRPSVAFGERATASSVDQDVRLSGASGPLGGASSFKSLSSAAEAPLQRVSAEACEHEADASHLPFTTNPLSSMPPPSEASAELPAVSRRSASGVLMTRILSATACDSALSSAALPLVTGERLSAVRTSAAAPLRPMGSSKSVALPAKARMSLEDGLPHSPESAPGELVQWRAFLDGVDGAAQTSKPRLRRWLRNVLKRPRGRASDLSSRTATDRTLCSPPPATASKHRQQPSLSRGDHANKPTKVDTSAWDELVTKAIGGKYLIVKSVSIGQMRLAVFARSDMFAAVSSVQASAVATGFGGVGTNKGAAAIACKVWGNQLAFVNCHLAAHQTKSLDRNKMYQEIIKGLRIGHDSMDCMTSFHHLFWMGDLNYRLDYPGAWRDEECPSDEMLDTFFDNLDRALATSDYSHFLSADQLRSTQRDNTAFVGFMEAAIAFPPTFKVERSGELAYVIKRLPAWCDRILWHTNMPLGQQPSCTQYFCSQAVSTSDHKPVFAVLEVPSVSAPPEVVHDAHSHLAMVFSSLQAEGLDQSKMVLTLRKRVQGVQALVAAVKHMCRKDDECGLWIAFCGDDIEHAPPAMATELSSRTSWKGNMRVQLKHSYHEHLKGRLLLINITYSTGRKGAEPRTIGRAVLPFCAVMPDNADLSSRAWHHANLSREFPFSAQIYHRGVRAGTLTGSVRWALKRPPALIDLMKPVARISAKPKRSFSQNLNPCSSRRSASVLQQRREVARDRGHSLTLPTRSDLGCSL